jgi:hypothetical protein
MMPPPMPLLLKLHRMRLFSLCPSNLSRVSSSFVWSRSDRVVLFRGYLFIYTVSLYDYFCYLLSNHAMSIICLIK